MGTSSNLSTSNKYVKYNIAITEKGEPDIVNNKRKVNVKINAWRTNTGYETYGSGTLKVIIDGADRSVSITSSQKITNAGITLFNKDYWISHNADGTKKLIVKASITISGAGLSSDLQSYSQNLTTIPRMSELTADNGTLGTEQTLNVTRKLSTFTHTIVAKCGDAESETICTESTKTNLTFTPPIEWASENTSGTSVAVKYTITTHNGNSIVGSKEYTKTCEIPPNVKPSCQITVTDATGFADTFGGYIQGISKAQVTITPIIAYDSQIKKYNATVNGETHNSSSFTTYVLNQAGNNVISGTVTDNRDRVGSDEATINVLAYSQPVLNFSVHRCDENGNDNILGEYCRVYFEIEVTSLNSKNGYSAFVKHKKQTESEYTTIVVDLQGYIQSGEVIFPADSGSTYDVEMSLSDSFYSVQKKTKLSTGFAIMHIPSSGKGITFGGIAERDGFCSKMESHFYKGLTMDIPILPNGNCDELIVSGEYYLGTYATNRPVELNGWISVKSYGDANYCYQKFITYTGEQYYRMRDNGVWLDWVCETCLDNKVLWSGIEVMNADKTIELSELISKQRTGIVLVWQRYNVSSATTSESDFNYYFVPKYHVAAHNTRGVSIHLRHGNSILAKYLYISDDFVNGYATIRGFSTNDNSAHSFHGQTVDNRLKALTAVIGV